MSFSKHRDAVLERSSSWSPRWRFLLSILIVGHLMAVGLPPLAFQTRGPAGASPSVDALLTPVRHYSEAIHTDRGYAFFAPDPGPSHLIQVIVDPESKSRKEFLIPSHDHHWPRLLYHRHFMLAEYLHNSYRPPLPQASVSPGDSAQSSEAQTPIESSLIEASRQRERYLRLWKSIDRHLSATNLAADGTVPKVATRRIEHLVPNYAAYVEQPIRLDDPQLYRALLDVPLSSDAIQDVPQPLIAPAVRSESVPLPDGEPAIDAGSP